MNVSSRAGLTADFSSLVLPAVDSRGTIDYKSLYSNQK